jgi:P4 family phage/plasmid primase-like protien
VAHGYITRLLADADRLATQAIARYRDHGQLRTLIQAARTYPPIRIDAAELDAKPGLLNCLNGTVDMRTGTLRPHDPEDRITKTTGVQYIPDATHHDWDQALRAVPDLATRAYLQRYYGSAGTGETDRDAPVLFLKGLGANGKSTLIGGIVRAYGDYAVQIPDQLLTGEDRHPASWMPLKGARLAYIEELPEDHTLPVARIKKLAATPEITARGMGKEYVTWTATHLLTVSTNYLPRVNETDHGTWRRLVLVDFPERFTGHEADPQLKRRLNNQKQREAVLAWLIQGARTWYAGDGDRPYLPPAVEAATDEWRNEGDELGRFLTTNLTPTGNPADRIPGTVLLARFNEELENQKQRPWSPKTFGERIRAHRYVRDSVQVTYDRGPRNQFPTGLTGAKWAN